MADEKEPYELTVELDSSRPDALAKGVEKLQDIAAEVDMTGKAKASITFKAWKQADLNEIMEAFEEYLYKVQIGLGCQMKIKRPGLRPESISKFRELYATPMDDAGWSTVAAQAEEPPLRPEEVEGEVLIAPDTHQRLALPEPGVVLMLETSDGEFEVEE